ncbi:hypothetical protein B0H13DRAFT_2231709 [Mycena leptocephala]|nr:hypothetical protein B0H13DRAFT_2231709 [Mycena leptocephala]
MPIARPSRSTKPHYCPICCTRFTNRQNCLRHMNQPHGRCHASLHPAVLKAGQTITEKYKLLASQNEEQAEEPFENMMDTSDTNDDREQSPPQDTGFYDYDPHLDDDSHWDDEPNVPAPNSPHREYYKGAAKTYGRVDTFMDIFRQDKYAKDRENNVYYPFASADEWELASYIIRSNMTVAATDEFLKLRLTAKMHLSFKSAKDLRSRIEILPTGPEWKAIPWTTRYPTKNPLTLYYRDPLECLQALLSNPLVQDFIHFTPFRLWETSEKLMRIYSEWLSGDVAWDLQDQVPEGATILGTVLSSDKTQLTAMTGNRQAHPLLISLADIDMDFRTKACHHAFLLLALLPIAKFREKNPEIVGVLASRLFHAILDFILQPLKKTAEIGMMMTDPLGWRRFCFTPLVGYIVDTPESALIAGVAGKRSSVTTASYKDFGDSFRHEPRTAEHTISQLMKLEETVDPWDLPAYIKKAKELGLSGVHRPFWRDWPLAEPSNFLTPEILHHWLKMFYDHLCKWCIEAVGAAEIDFRFSVLRPHTGMRHFKEGISKAKQTTGREHRDIQRYIVPVIAGANGISKPFLATIASLNDFFYHGQAPSINEQVLQKMTDCLTRFHDNKHAILKAGARKGKKGPINNWYIPKLEFLQSVVPAIRANGVPLQWSADVTEHAHITLVKDPASNSNNQNYEPQICRHLDRRDKCKQFDLATAITSAGIDFDEPSDPDEIDDEEPSLLVNRTSLLAEGRFPNAPTPFRTFSSLDSNTAFHLSRDHVGRQLTVDAAATKFRLPDFRPALAAYLHRKQGNQLIIGGKRPNLRDDTLLFDKIEYWNNVRIQSRSFHDTNKILVPETINAAPPDGHWKCGHADAVIVNTSSEHQWPHSGLAGHTICQLRMIFRVRFNIVPQMRGGFPEPASGMYQLKRARRVDKSIMGDIIPLDRLRVRVELTPNFGKMADRRLKKETSLDYCDEFWLAKWFNKELFFALSQ